MILKSVYYLQGEQNLYRIELTQAQTVFVINYCKDFNSLHSYFMTLDPETWVAVDDCERPLRGILVDRFLLDVLDELYDDHGQDAMRMIELFTGKTKDLRPGGSPDWVPVNPEDGTYACFDRYKSPEVLAEWYRELDEAS